LFSWVQILAISGLEYLSIMINSLS